MTPIKCLMSRGASVCHRKILAATITITITTTTTTTTKSITATSTTFFI
jgi:hypothetical protein